LSASFATAVDGLVFATTRAPGEKNRYLRALVASTGKVQWATRAGTFFEIHAVASADANLVLAGDSTAMTAYNRTTGKQVWSVAPGFDTQLTPLYVPSVGDAPAQIMTSGHLPGRMVLVALDARTGATRSSTTLLTNVSDGLCQGLMLVSNGPRPVVALTCVPAQTQVQTQTVLAVGPNGKPTPTPSVGGIVTATCPNSATCRASCPRRRFFPGCEAHGTSGGSTLYWCSANGQTLHANAYGSSSTCDGAATSFEQFAVGHCYVNGGTATTFEVTACSNK
jgi:hypothetical protein